MSNSNDNNTLTALSEAMANAVETAGNATVLVNGRRRYPASGIAYAADLILTANHVLEREEDIPVLLPDGSQISASLAGRDPGSDLAVLKLAGTLPVIAQAANRQAQVGQLVLALGRPTPEGIQASLGVVSAIGGPVHTRRGGLLERHLRTDAVPYPGFSGGPLIDSAGQVLGMNTSGLTRGASLAIPVSLAWQIAESLARHGSVKRGYLGVRSQPVDIPNPQKESLARSQETGLLLVGVEENSPAEAGGLMVGDIIVGFAGAPLSEPDELLTRLTGEVVGKPTPVEVLRGGQLQEITVAIGDRK
ncbi:S1C family serine protease [Chloroflexota bacterium]